ncbi:MAG: membrane protein insertase YidC [Alphaproteobacteria bacterium]|nr:membrane protein insertase YidC [Alphaproteobacteria bacterium]
MSSTPWPTISALWIAGAGGRRGGPGRSLALGFLGFFGFLGVLGLGLLVLFLFLFPLALLRVLLVTIEMRQAPFFGWIQDLSVRDPASIWTVFGLVPWNHLAYVPEFLDIGIWPIIMGVTMFLQQKLNPQPTDPVQAKVFMWLPVLFTFLLAPFSAGLVIYWAWNNALSIAQQWLIMRRMGVKVD